MTDRAQLNLKLPEEQKARWKTAAKDSPEYTSLSQLVRQAVERELSGGHSGGPSGMNADTLTTLQETIEENREALTGLRQTVDSIHKATERRDDRRAKAEVWSALPDAGEGATPGDIAEDLGGPFDATVVAGYLDEMRQDGHVTSADGTHFRRVD